MNKRFGAFSSSVDPNALSQTVNGLIVLSAGIVAYFAAQNGVTVAVPEIQAQVAVLTTAIGSIWAAFGAIRKVIVWGYDLFTRIRARQ